MEEGGVIEPRTDGEFGTSSPSAFLKLELSSDTWGKNTQDLVVYEI